MPPSSRFLSALLLACCLGVSACDSTEPGNLPGTFAATVETTSGASSLSGVALAGLPSQIPDVEIPAELVGFTVAMVEGSVAQPSPSGRALVIGWSAAPPPAPGTYAIGLGEGESGRALAVYSGGREAAEVYVGTSGTVTVEAVNQLTFRGRFELEATSSEGVGGSGGRVTVRGAFSAGRVGAP